MGQKDYIITLALILIFSIGIINYALWFADDNNAAVDLASDAEFSEYVTESSADAQAYRVEVSGISEAFRKSSITEGSETSEKGSTFKQTSSSPFKAFQVITRVGFQKIFGSESAFDPIMAIIISTVVLIAALLTWKTWKGGNPE
jgi:hypothetical protein